MVQFFESIPDYLVKWIGQQQCFWVATAPLSADGHVNVSPKGVQGCFHVVNQNKVWYEDLSGSGVETIAHVRENGRITIMFSAFDGPPRIMRLFGKGTIHEFGTSEFQRLVPMAQRKPGCRSAIMIDVHKVSTSCGYAVPYYDFRGNRSTLLEFFKKRESADITSSGSLPAEDGIKAYWTLKNMKSIDGVPGLQSAPTSSALPESLELVQLKAQSPVISARTARKPERALTQVPLDIRLVFAFMLGVAATLISTKTTSLLPFMT